MRTMVQSGHWVKLDKKYIMEEISRSFRSFAQFQEDYFSPEAKELPGMGISNGHFYFSNFQSDGIVLLSS